MLASHYLCDITFHIGITVDSGCHPTKSLLYLTLTDLIRCLPGLGMLASHI